MNKRLLRPVIAVLLIGIGVGVFVVQRKLLVSQRSEFESSGYENYAPPPEPFTDPAREEELAEQYVELASHWSDEQIAATVRFVLFHSPSPLKVKREIRALQSLGDRTQFAVLEQLRDTSFYAHLVKPYGVDWSSGSPFQRACSLLGDHPPATALEAMAPFLGDPSEYIRASAASVIGRIGTAAAAPLVERALNDPDELVQSTTLSALNGLDSKQLDEDTRRELFNRVEAYLERTMGTNAVRPLYNLDPERATTFFLSPEVLSPQCHYLHEVLRLLADHHVPPPRERLLALLDQLDAEKLDYPQAQQLGQAIRWLGQLKNPDDRPRIEKLTTHGKEDVATLAFESLLISHGIEGFAEKIRDKILRDGFESLTQAEQYYTAVLELDADVRNRGFEAYFSHTSSDHWRAAVAGLEAMGFQTRAALVREALSYVQAQQTADSGAGRTPPASLSDYEDRMRRLKQLDKEYYACRENVSTFVIRYVLGHLDEFK